MDKRHDDNQRQAQRNDNERDDAHDIRWDDMEVHWHYNWGEGT